MNRRDFAHANIRLAFETRESDPAGKWVAESLELPTGMTSEATRNEALRVELVEALRLLADELENGGTIHNSVGKPVLEWDDHEPA